MKAHLYTIGLITLFCAWTAGGIWWHEAVWWFPLLAMWCTGVYLFLHHGVKEFLNRKKS